MNRLLPLALLMAILAFSNGCKKDEEPQNLVPKVVTPKLLITAIDEFNIQRYHDTIRVPVSFRSDSARQITIKTIAFLGSESEIGVRLDSTSGVTPLDDTLIFYAKPTAQISTYFKKMSITYDADTAEHAFLVRVVANSNCSFLFTGAYGFRYIYPASPTLFNSTITETGLNRGMISNFANSGNSIQVTFDCAHEFMDIPLQPYDANTTVKGSGSWSPSGLTINYTLTTSAFSTSGIIQGTR